MACQTDAKERPNWKIKELEWQGTKCAGHYWIENHFTRVAIRLTDHENRGDVISPLHLPFRLVEPFNPQQSRRACGESPHLSGSEAFIEQPLDHGVGSGVAPVRRKPQRQVVGPSEFRKDCCGLIRVDAVQ